MRPFARSDRRGSAAIEFALTLPVLITLMLAVLEYGWVFFQQSSVVNAVRDGTRVAVQAPDYSCVEEVANAQTRAVLARFGLDCDSIPDCDIITDLNPYDDTADTLTVKVSIPYEPLTGLIPVPNHIAAEVSMMVRADPLAL